MSQTKNNNDLGALDNGKFRYELYQNQVKLTGIFDKNKNKKETKIIKVFRDDKGNPFFFGKYVAGVLGYANERQALRKHVSGYNKMDYSQFHEQFGAGIFFFF